MLHAIKFIELTHLTTKTRPSFSSPSLSQTVLSLQRPSKRGTNSIMSTTKKFDASTSSVSAATVEGLIIYLESIRKVPSHIKQTLSKSALSRSLLTTFVFFVATLDYLCSCDLSRAIMLLIWTFAMFDRLRHEAIWIFSSALNNISRSTTNPFIAHSTSNLLSHSKSISSICPPLRDTFRTRAGICKMIFESVFVLITFEMRSALPLQLQQHRSKTTALILMVLLFSADLWHDELLSRFTSLVIKVTESSSWKAFFYGESHAVSTKDSSLYNTAAPPTFAGVINIEATSAATTRTQETTSQRAHRVLHLSIGCLLTAMLLPQFRQDLEHSLMTPFFFANHCNAIEILFFPNDRMRTKMQEPRKPVVRVVTRWMLLGFLMGGLKGLVGYQELADQSRIHW